jgi:hypothetical protein
MHPCTSGIPGRKTGRNLDGTIIAEGVLVEDNADHRGACACGDLELVQEPAPKIARSAKENV